MNYQEKNKKSFNSDIPFIVIVSILMTVVAFVYIVPLLYIISGSFSSANAIFSGKMLFIPEGFHLKGYAAIFAHNDFWRSFFNTILYCGLAVIIAVPLTVMAAYPLSRNDFVAKKPIMIIYTITMFFSGGLVPTYLLVTSLGLYNTPWAFVLPGVSVWNIIVIRQYFVTRISGEIFEAASIDGCSNFRFLVCIGFPLAVPIIIVISMYTIVGQWNSYFNQMLYLESRELFPLQLILRELLLSGSGSAGSDWSDLGASVDAQESMQFGMIIISAVPVILLYAFTQKYFLKGVMVGSLKG